MKFDIQKGQGANMAYENRSAAYDLSLFDEELTSSAAPKRKQDDESDKRTRKKQKNNV